ncbi:hypothetical protein SAMN05421810_103364 [Amycolatopsis arida]|uniref:Uncharacterized protein n=1 Tax=Amycolatopsis arida TaxID=587909 RepID=A0A1I5T3F2_9PSEU|nr:hypothetical protein [Amycolatopsis arida]TDX96257.1 hypothetical protein CLV69_103394 [Amycolatopsis arida]SFP77157.1 hypothetical protein SAMN05421810_103364 [Amycolatopsis arida]
MSRLAVLDDAARPSGIPLRFTVPEQLREIPLEEEPGQRIRRTYESLATGLRGLSDEQRLRMVLVQELVLGKLLREGAVYVANCVARSEVEPTRLTAGQFSILVKEAKLHGDRPLLAVARGLASPGEPREIVLNEYPAGEALVIGEEVLVELPPMAGGYPVVRRQRVRQAQIVFAFPDRRRVAILAVSTQDLPDWDGYLRILNDLAHSVSFDPPGGSPLSRRLDGLG